MGAITNENSCLCMMYVPVFVLLKDISQKKTLLRSEIESLLYGTVAIWYIFRWKLVFLSHQSTVWRLFLSYRTNLTLKHFKRGCFGGHFWGVSVPCRVATSYNHSSDWNELKELSSYWVEKEQPLSRGPLCTFGLI